MRWSIFIPLAILFMSCTTVYHEKQVNGRQRTIAVEKFLNLIPVRSNVLLDQEEKRIERKEEKEDRLEERMQRPVTIVNWASLGLGLAAVAGSCLIQAPNISKKLWELAAAMGLVYLITLVIMIFLDLLINPIVRVSVGLSIVILSTYLIRRFWLKGCILKEESTT